jgi:hypothetical protein
MNNRRRTPSFTGALVLRGGVECCTALRAPAAKESASLASEPVSVEDQARSPHNVTRLHNTPEPFAVCSHPLAAGVHF